MLPTITKADTLRRMADSTISDALHFKNNRHDTCDCIPTFVDFVYNQGRVKKKPENNVVLNSFQCCVNGRRWVACGICHGGFRLPGEKNAVRAVTRHVHDVHYVPESEPKRKRRKTSRSGSDTWRAINSIANGLDIAELTAQADDVRAASSAVLALPLSTTIESRANV